MADVQKDYVLKPGRLDSSSEAPTPDSHPVILKAWAILQGVYAKHPVHTHVVKWAANGRITVSTDMTRHLK